MSSNSTIVITRDTGRRMELVSVEASGHLRLIVAKTDPERRQWISWRQSVLWPPEWVWLPGQQMEFHLE